MAKRRFFFGFWVAALAAVVLGVGTVAAADPGDVVIATQKLHKALKVGDVAAGNAIGVAFQKNNLSYLRWSLDDGATFSAEWPLRAGNPAKSPRLASCGNWMWATSLWRTTAGSGRVTVDFLDVTAPATTAGKFVIQDAFTADIACNNGVVAVAYWSSTGLMLTVVDGSCAQPCTPAFTTTLATNANEAPQIAAVDDGFVVTWPPGQGLVVQHFAVAGSGAGISVTPDAPVTLLPGIAVWSPVIAGDGSRVVVVYVRRNDTHMRISEDYGQSFGPRIIVKSIANDPCCSGSGPDSVDARDGRILVDVGMGGGDPPGIHMAGRFTTNDGATWKTTTGHSGGTQIGILLSGFAVEAWDSHHYAYSIYGNVPQRIGFRTTSVP